MTEYEMWHVIGKVGIEVEFRSDPIPKSEAVELAAEKVGDTDLELVRVDVCTGPGCLDCFACDVARGAPA